MAFSARAFRVLIASPSDVAKERDIAVQVIQQWNDANSREREVVLLPVRWETHAAPEMGAAQGVINRQFADDADAVLAIFWTRLGTATSDADSGTLEEIQRADAAGKLVMLYFSEAPVSPSLLDLSQLSKLKEFKSHAWTKALTGKYADLVEFKDAFAKDLDIQVRRLFLSAAGELGTRPPPYTDIVLKFSDPESGDAIDGSRNESSTFFDVSDFDSIPDYYDKSGNAGTTGDAAGDLFAIRPNRRYLRQAATYLVLASFFRPVRFSFANKGGIGARDVYVELEFETDEPVLVVTEKSKIPENAPKKRHGVGLLGYSTQLDDPKEIIQPSSGWKYQFDLGALQPQRVISPPVEIVIGAIKPCNVKIRARIFADTLAIPTVCELNLSLNVTVNQISSALLITGIPSNGED